MIDKSSTCPGAGRNPRKQEESVAADTLDLLNQQAELVRANLVGMQRNLADVQQNLPTAVASELQEANEQLVLAALHAEAIAEQAVSHLDELARSTQYDALTDTPNRALMLDRLENAIANARRHRTRIAVLFVDLDEFKQINDTLGHPVGDAVVQLVARRLESVVRHSDTVSRHGGDEFLVLMAEITQPSDAALIAEKILAGLATPSRVDNHLISLSASVGIALFPEDGDNPASLITKADAAMYSCKKQGGGNFQFFSESILCSHGLPLPPCEARDELSTAGPYSAMRTLRAANEQLVVAALTAQELEKQTAQKHGRQSKFMAMVAHELRNSLTPVEIAAGVLKRVQIQDLIEDAKNLIESQTTHMLKLVDDLLDSARGGTGEFRMEPCTVDIADVLERVVRACRPETAARHQRLTTRLPPGPLNIQGDPVRLAQIFRNLLDNACRYSPDGGEITLVCEHSNDSVVITVSDNGIGFPSDELASIFKLSAHDDRPPAARHGGLGIGLGVVRDLVEAHGGAIVARSPGENLGSEFVITLPIRRELPEASLSSLP